MSKYKQGNGEASTEFPKELKEAMDQVTAVQKKLIATGEIDINILMTSIYYTGRSHFNALVMGASDEALEAMVADLADHFIRKGHPLSILALYSGLHRALKTITDFTTLDPHEN